MLFLPGLHFTRFDNFEEKLSNLHEAENNKFMLCDRTTNKGSNNNDFAFHRALLRDDGTMALSLARITNRTTYLLPLHYVCPQNNYSH